MHIQSGFSSDDSDVVIPFLLSSSSQLEDLPRFLMGGLGTKHRIWFQHFGTNVTLENRP